MSGVDDDDVDWAGTGEARPGRGAGAAAGEADEGMPSAARVASAIGLFLAGAGGTPLLLIIVANVYAALGVDSTRLALGLVFTTVGVPALATLLAPRWRAFGFGAFFGLAFAAFAVAFYLIVLQADEPRALALAG